MRALPRLLEDQTNQHLRRRSDRPRGRCFHLVSILSRQRRCERAHRRRLTRVALRSTSLKTAGAECPIQTFKCPNGSEAEVRLSRKQLFRSKSLLALPPGGPAALRSAGTLGLLDISTLPEITYPL